MRRKKKKRITCPYFILITLTSLIFTGIYGLKENLFSGEQQTKTADELQQNRIENEQIQTVSGNNGGSGDVSGNKAENTDSNTADDKNADNSSADGKNKGNNSGKISTGETGADGNSVSQNEMPDKKENQNNSGSKEHTGEKVGEEYLNDVLFIGDSRTSTLMEYAGWDNATFYVKNGLTIWEVMDAKIAPSGGKTVTVKEALQNDKFGKVYIMLGINELGRGTPETFAEQFGKVIEQIKELQPDAVIVMQAIMHVTATKDAEETYINNKEINARNEKLKELADSAGVCWLNVNRITDDKDSGCLTEDYSFDGVHLKVKYLDIWKDFILENPF